MVPVEVAQSRDGVTRRMMLWAPSVSRRFLWLALVGAWIWLAVVLVGKFESAKRYADLPTYSRVQGWLESAECTQKRGVILAVCTANGAIAPIEDVSLADDPGHALLANVIAWLRPRPITRLTLTRLNLLLNAGALVLLSGLLFMAGCQLAAVMSVWVGIRWGIPGPHAGADAFAAFFAAYCLALLPSIIASHTLTGRRSAPRLAVGCIVGGAAVAGAILLRQPIGLAGVMAASGLVVALSLTEGLNMRRAVAGGTFILVLLLATQVSSGIFAVRGLLFGVTPGRLTQSHGVSHNLYIGLGTHPNPWGIKWDDMIAAQAVARVDPSVAYVSPRYYEILWHLYFNALRSHPSAALRIYLQKLAETVQYDRVGWKLVIAMALLVVAWRVAPAEAHVRVYAAAGACAMTVLILLQGVLATPWPVLFYPAAFGANLLLFALADVALKMSERRLARHAEESVWPRTSTT